jgi:hypothetical protein
MTTFCLSWIQTQNAFDVSQYPTKIPSWLFGSGFFRLTSGVWTNVRAPKIENMRYLVSCGTTSQTVLCLLMLLLIALTLSVYSENSHVFLSGVFYELRTSEFILAIFYSITNNGIFTKKNI